MNRTVHRFHLGEAAERLEELLAMAFNGDTVIIESGTGAVQLVPVEGRVVPGRKYTADDFRE
ncbi:MAG: hypothetical protein JO053_05505 [Acidobacteria bacterium]|nr:hypothetical protein [Acidobacteriota bacterium]